MVHQKTTSISSILSESDDAAALLTAALALAQEAVRMDTQYDSRGALDKYVSSARLLRDVLGRMQRDSIPMSILERRGSEAQRREWEHARVKSIVRCFTSIIAGDGVLTHVPVQLEIYVARIDVLCGTYGVHVPELA